MVSLAEVRTAQIQLVELERLIVTEWILLTEQAGMEVREVVLMRVQVERAEMQTVEVAVVERES